MKDKQQHDFYEVFWEEELKETVDHHILDGDDRKGLDILSIGCGAGTDCWDLTSDHNVCGIDISESGLEIAKKHGIKTKFSSVTEPIPYPDSSFDVVIAKDILEHILDPMSVAIEIRRVLRPNGHMVINIPNQFHWRFRLRYLFGHNLVWKTFMHDHTELFDEWNYIHVRFFTWKGLNKFLSLAGFKITKQYFDFGTWEHYFDIDNFDNMYHKKWSQGEKKSKRGILIVYFLNPVWKVLNVVFPKSFRRVVVGLAPGLLTTAFYLRCTPIVSSDKTIIDVT